MAATPPEQHRVYVSLNSATPLGMKLLLLAGAAGVMTWNITLSGKAGAVAGVLVLLIGYVTRHDTQAIPIWFLSQRFKTRYDAGLVHPRRILRKET